MPFVVRAQYALQWATEAWMYSIQFHENLDVGFSAFNAFARFRFRRSFVYAFNFSFIIDCRRRELQLEFPSLVWYDFLKRNGTTPDKFLEPSDAIVFAPFTIEDPKRPTRTLFQEFAAQIPYVPTPLADIFLRTFAIATFCIVDRRLFANGFLLPQLIFKNWVLWICSNVVSQFQPFGNGPTSNFYCFCWICTKLPITNGHHQNIRNFGELHCKHITRNNKRQQHTKDKIAFEALGFVCMPCKEQHEHWCKIYVRPELCRAQSWKFKVYFTKSCDRSSHPNFRYYSTICKPKPRPLHANMIPYAKHFAGNPCPHISQTQIIPCRCHPYPPSEFLLFHMKIPWCIFPTETMMILSQRTHSVSSPSVGNPIRWNAILEFANKKKIHSQILRTLPWKPTVSMGAGFHPRWFLYLFGLVFASFSVSDFPCTH